MAVLAQYIENRISKQSVPPESLMLAHQIVSGNYQHTWTYAPGLQGSVQDTPIILRNHQQRLETDMVKAYNETNIWEGSHSQEAGKGRGSSQGNKLMIRSEDRSHTRETAFMTTVQLNQSWPVSLVTHTGEIISDSHIREYLPKPYINFLYILHMDSLLHLYR